MHKKDLFSATATGYAAYRPQYPKALVKYLARLVQYRGVAWDCATGNGQLAVELEQHFNLVCASDISAAQIRNAPARSGIHYSVQPAESTDYPDQFFDLIAVGQAIHWLNIPAFYDEVKRVLRPGGIFALIGYGLCRVDEDVNNWIDYFYKEVVGEYWEPERSIIDDAFQSLYFPFDPIPMPAFQMKASWTIEHFIGYLRTWSAVIKYKQSRGEDPVALHEKALRSVWQYERFAEVEFPLLLKVGRY